MPLFRIERYEIHTQAYVVEADNEAEAVKKTLDGLAEVAPDEFSEWTGWCDTRGLETKGCPKLTAALNRLGEEFPDGIIPSIKSVEAE